MKKQRIFFDSDGVLATWNQDASIEEVASPGYFANLIPMENPVMALKRMVEMKDKYEVFILSSVFEDKHSIMDKNIWIDRYLPEVDRKHRIYVPYSRTKTEYIQAYTGYRSENDVLVDDFTKNLSEWHGIGIKMLNGINWTKGTWNGFIISHTMKPHVMVSAILALAGTCTA